MESQPISRKHGDQKVYTCHSPCKQSMSAKEPQWPCFSTCLLISNHVSLFTQVYEHWAYCECYIDDCHVRVICLRLVNDDPLWMCECVLPIMIRVWTNPCQIEKPCDHCVTLPEGSSATATLPCIMTARDPSLKLLLISWKMYTHGAARGVLVWPHDLERTKPK